VQWEYVVLDLGYGSQKFSQDKLNELGRHGWELVTVSNMHLAFLKRPTNSAMAQRSVLPLPPPFGSGEEVA
jgi:hypothetical protein